MNSLNRFEAKIGAYLMLYYLVQVLALLASIIDDITLRLQTLASKAKAIIIRLQIAIYKINAKMNVIVLKLQPIIMMADDEDNYKDRFKYIIVAIIILVVGAVTVSIVAGVGTYILNVFNTTAIKIPSSYNFVNPIAPALGSIFQILVVVLIIVALFFVIRYLMKSTDTF